MMFAGVRSKFYVMFVFLPDEAAADFWTIGADDDPDVDRSGWRASVFLQTGTNSMVCLHAEHGLSLGIFAAQHSVQTGRLQQESFPPVSSGSAKHK